MKNIIRAALALFFLSLALPSQAAIRVLATTADWGALTQELGGEHVDVYVATTAMQDVHRVEAKPSLVARARTADLLVANGAELEIGWLPVLQQESGNPKIQRGAPGYFEATSVVTLVEKPEHFDRAMGDIHPLGNPHIQLDPRNVAAVAKALTARLTAIDPADADYYAATPPKLILLNAYNDPKAANWLSERVHAPAVVLPFSVGGSKEAKDLFGLFDDTIEKLLGAAK
jgi:zinc/manganese transport system substrate-binding protein